MIMSETESGNDEESANDVSMTNDELVEELNDLQEEVQELREAVDFIIERKGLRELMNDE